MGMRGPSQRGGDKPRGTPGGAVPRYRHCRGLASPAFTLWSRGSSRLCQWIWHPACEMLGYGGKRQPTCLGPALPHAWGQESPPGVPPKGGDPVPISDTQLGATCSQGGAWLCRSS